MEKEIFGNGNLVIAMSAMNRTGFDFIGRFIAFENGSLVLENPLVLDYDEKRVLKRLAPLHLPFGTVDIVNQRNIIALPLDGLAYYVAVPEEGDDWMHLEYRAAFRRDS